MLQEKSIAKVIVDLPVREVDRIFDYEIPAEFIPDVSVGSVVLVPFGSAKQIGYIIGLTSHSEVEKVLPIEAVVNEKPVFSERIVELCRWIAEYYLSTINEALKLAVPPGYGRKIIQSVRITGQPKGNLTTRQEEVYDALKELGGNAQVSVLREACGGKDIMPIIKRLSAARLVERYYEVEQPRVSELTVQYALLAGSLEEAVTRLKRAPKQKAILEHLFLRGGMPISKLLNETKSTYLSLRALVKGGYVKIEEREVNRDPSFYFSQEDNLVELTDEQQSAVSQVVDAIESGFNTVFLLQGVTGSGKTEVYLRSIQKALEKGKSAIVLVPEIALTAQVVARFRARFGETVAILHSGLSIGERFDQWRGIRDGRYRVVVGARSAIFAPLSNLGIIVVDEEHEASYKQGKNPKYNAREVAIKRAELEGACVILGSATPSLESKWRSEVGAYKPLFLHKRVQQRELPKIEIVDMRKELNKKELNKKELNKKELNKKEPCKIEPSKKEPHKREYTVFSQLLRQRLDETIAAGEKAILFINRRGFSNFILCEDCGFVPRCRYCAVSLTYHSINHSLRCHHCNFAAKALDKCLRCGSHQIKYPGIGTQRVESELRRLYPEVQIIRMDADTTSRKDAHQKRLTKFSEEKSAILLGTQMIAKGLDFPEVTLVGVVNADTALHLPDFRAAERTFQLLMQVSGRAGRGKRPGRVVIQTYSPDSYPIRSVLNCGYDEFYRQEIEFRRELNYPPFSTIIRLLFSSREPKTVVEIAKRSAEIIKSSNLEESLSLIGPSPAPILKVKGDYRWHVILKTQDGLTVRHLLEDNFRRFIPRNYKDKVSVSIDVDPVWVL